MQKSHNLQFIAEAQIFDKDGKLVRTQLANTKPSRDNTIEITKYNEERKIIDKVELPFKSFTSNFIKWLYERAINSTTTPYIKRLDGSDYTYSSTYTSMRGRYGANWAGLVVGTSSSAVSIADYDLGSRCTHGYSTGNIDYSRTIVDEPAVDGSDYKMSVRRFFANYSGAAISIRETGAIVTRDEWGDENRHAFLLARDTYNEDASPINISIANNQSFEVKYNFYHATSSGLTGNFMKYLHGLWNDSYDYDVVDTAGSPTNTGNNSYFANWFRFATPAYGTATWGILVGRGNTAATINDYQMDDQIAHGSGSGQLLYWEQEFRTPTIGSSDAYFQLKRGFYNDTSSSIDVEEAGAYGYNDSDGKYAMMIRTVFSPAITLQPTESVKIIFTFKVEV